MGERQVGDVVFGGHRPRFQFQLLRADGVQPQIEHPVSVVAGDILLWSSGCFRCPFSTFRQGIDDQQRHEENGFTTRTATSAAAVAFVNLDAMSIRTIDDKAAWRSIGRRPATADLPIPSRILFFRQCGGEQGFTTRTDRMRHIRGRRQFGRSRSGGTSTCLSRRASRCRRLCRFTGLDVSRSICHGIPFRRIRLLIIALRGIRVVVTRFTGSCVRIVARLLPSLVIDLVGGPVGRQLVAPRNLILIVSLLVGNRLIVSG